MKKILLLFTYLLLLLPVCAKTINGGVSYTLEEARYDAFYDVVGTIDIQKYQEYMVDKNIRENIEAISKNKFYLKDRKLVKFFDNNDLVTYSICYNENKNVVYFYDNKGLLQYIDFINMVMYPKKTVSYNKNGQLDSIVLSVTLDNQFVFDVNKKLIAHWIGNNCYNEKGELIGTRK